MADQQTEGDDAAAEQAPAAPAAPAKKKPKQPQQPQPPQQTADPAAVTENADGFFTVEGMPGYFADQATAERVARQTAKRPKK